MATAIGCGGSGESAAPPSLASTTVDSALTRAQEEIDALQQQLEAEEAERDAEEAAETSALRSWNQDADALLLEENDLRDQLQSNAEVGASAAVCALFPMQEEVIDRMLALEPAPDAEVQTRWATMIFEKQSLVRINIDACVAINTGDVIRGQGLIDQLGPATTRHNSAVTEFSAIIAEKLG